ncbi:MAG: TraR/DksA C4-type zinc finger protein [Burkholderiales bacterium]|nr:TraR/DksA C4-type zinc finger protein [Burkholderiales bacterium]
MGRFVTASSTTDASNNAYLATCVGHFEYDPALDWKKMDALTTSERDHLATMLRQRKQPLRDEIRSGLARMRTEGYEELLSGTSDAGDESVATLLTDIANAEVARDAAELQDIIAAQARLAAGTYGTCIDCGTPIPYARLTAYPTAKRCLHCQQIRETTRAPFTRP